MGNQPPWACCSPRMTQSQRDAIASPANGLTIYQTDNTPGIYVNSGSAGSPAWIMAGNGGSWTVTGNSGTSAGTNFIGTSTCIGTVATATATDMVRIGNTFVASIGGFQNWTNISDSRFKENVKEDVPGLAFINQLRPVTYQLNPRRSMNLTG